MATISHDPKNREKIGWYLSHCNHNIWDQFSPDQQESMLDEDLFAGRSVSLVLGSIVVMGLMLSAVTLLAVLMAS